MKIVKFDDQFEVKLHNKREEAAYRIMVDIYERSKKLHVNPDGDRHVKKSIIETIHMPDIQGTLNTFFYMDILKYINVKDLSFYKDNGYGWY